MAVPGAVVHVLDRIGGERVHAPRPDLPAWPFDALLSLLVAIQFVNVGLLAWFFTIHTLWSIDSLVAILLVGASSGYSGIVVAHELIHRRDARARLAGRALLCTVLYEHFYTEHVRGHHVRVGTPEDPATAHFEHWGLERRGPRVRPQDSWDTHSRFTYYALTGLTRHADHHAFAARPYQQLRVHPEAPLLPRGYIAMFPLVMFRNREFRRLMTEELERRRLGPFASAPPGQGA